MRKFKVRTGSEPSRFITYANVVSTLALVAAIGGGSAVAAAVTHGKSKPKPHHHYVITSTSQIKPSVVSKLHGANGANGANGATGATGAAGATGPAGATGAAGAVAGYSASASNVTFTGGTNTLILSKALPAGSYVLGGSAQIGASSSSLSTQFEVSCTLSDTGSSATEVSEYTGLTNFSVIVVAVNVTTIPFDLAVTTTSASTAKLTCSDVSNSGNSYAVAVNNATLTAVQTSANS